MMSLMSALWLSLALFLFALPFPSHSQSTPLERYFFTSKPFLEVNTVSSENLDFLEEELYDASRNNNKVLEYRVLIPFADSAINSGPLNPNQAVAWTLWRSAEDYLARENIFREYAQDPDVIIRRQYFLKGADLGDCRYCGETFDEDNLPVTALFLLDQNNGAYPIVNTFGIDLRAQTQREPGTLDYVIAYELSSEPTATSINMRLNMVDFWELYRNPDAFNTHVANVNTTLKPEAENWFVDLGATGTTWYQVQKLTGDCYKPCSIDDSDIIPPLESSANKNREQAALLILALALFLSLVF